MSDRGTVTAPDGRQLGVAEWGDPDGTPLFTLHGTPGSRLRRPPNDDAVRDAGLRLVMYDRPGYGASDRHVGRRVVDCVADITAIADALGIDRFHVLGGSGGAPHALAAGACLPDRVLGVEALVSPAPRDRIDFDFMAGMDPENVKEFGWALESEEVLHRELVRYAGELESQFDEQSDGVLTVIDFGESDRELVDRDDVRRSMGEMVREAFRNGVWGWVDDDLAMLEPWGFELDDVAVPVHGPSIDILALNDVLEKLAAVDERKSLIVELHFFG
ncbi:MAG: alpha/beta fold hydrolase, partial [Marmoricola sp.]|nr:alpha/beta fold hydrolase [Marmoricola sp.]